jgi:hypothetical protein
MGLADSVLGPDLKCSESMVQPPRGGASPDGAARARCIAGLRSRSCPAWVTTGKAQSEQMFSGSLQLADINERCRHFRVGRVEDGRGSLGPVAPLMIRAFGAHGQTGLMHAATVMLTRSPRRRASSHVE